MSDVHWRAWAKVPHPLRKKYIATAYGSFFLPFKEC